MHSRLGARAQLGLDVGHADRGGFERVRPSTSAQTSAAAAVHAGSRSSVPGARDTAVHELELDPHVVAAGGVPGLTGGAGRSSEPARSTLSACRMTASEYTAGWYRRSHDGS